MGKMKILTPKGMITMCDQVVPVVEKRLIFNGKQRRLTEAASGMEEKPTALAFQLTATGHQMMGVMPCGTQELFVGNLKTEKVAEIMKGLLKDGYADLSCFEYQKEFMIDKTVFDE